MAGSTKDFNEHGHIYPNFLLEIQNKPLIQRIIESLNGLASKIIFIIRKEDNEKFYIGDIIHQLEPKGCVITVDGMTKGAVCTALFAIDQINNDDELLVINGDQLIKADLHDAIDVFHEKKADAGIIVFKSIHPRWSYVLQDSMGDVVQTSEKRPISNLATAGCYWYKRGKEFIASCFSVIEKDVQVQGNFYISSTFNELILKQKKICCYEIPRKDYVSFATYQMYENFISHRGKSDD
jgi:dTDP-glucose pyrophosphorylase